ncbi:hypothetical protein [Demequina sediminicola]|uniref:hypothetical protein n=1 Tax=Demequina sediminicola TaxID=1095026 RepID=UPI000784A425|nr:hypothetical protein [Demequina sediminicola]
MTHQRSIDPVEKLRNAVLNGRTRKADQAAYEAEMAELKRERTTKVSAAFRSLIVPTSDQEN